MQVEAVGNQEEDRFDGVENETVGWPRSEKSDLGQYAEDRISEKFR